MIFTRHIIFHSLASLSEVDVSYRRRIKLFGLEDNTQLTELEAMTIKETIKISQIFGQADACTLVADTQILEDQWYLAFNVY